MNTQEFIAKQKQLFQQIIQKDIPLQRAAASTLRMQAERIFVEGKNSPGSEIGHYNSTKPLYINPNLSPKKFPTRGKPDGTKFRTTKTFKFFYDTGTSGEVVKTKTAIGESKFQNDQPHKTGWFESYKSFKQKIGQPNDKVRLVLSGDLRSDFSSSQLQKINTHEYISGVKRPANIKKAEGNESRYGKIFSSTTQEVNNFFNVAQKEYDLLIASVNA